MLLRDYPSQPRRQAEHSLAVALDVLAEFDAVLRDDLDENGGGDLDFEAAAGSGVMIVADLQLCKFFRRRC